MKRSKIMAAVLTSMFMLAVGCAVPQEGDLPPEGAETGESDSATANGMDDQLDSPSEGGVERIDSTAQASTSDSFYADRDNKGGWLPAAVNSPYTWFYIRANRNVIDKLGYTCGGCQAEWASRTVINADGSFRISVFSGPRGRPWRDSRGVMEVNRAGRVTRSTLDANATRFEREVSRAHEFARVRHPGWRRHLGEVECVGSVLAFIGAFGATAISCLLPGANLALCAFGTTGTVGAALFIGEECR